MIKRDYIKIKVSDLKSYEKNNKKHWENIDQIVKSIQANTYIAPIIIDENNVILAWHWRKLALDKLQVTEAEVLQVSWLSEEQKRDFRIRDNKLTELSEWDFENLKFELDDLDIPDLSDLFKDEEELKVEPEAEEDDYVVPETITTDIVVWDLFEIGEHRLLCGDSTDAEQVAKLMNGEKADMVFTDPPYGIGYDNEDRWSGIDKQNHSAKRNKGKMILGDAEDFNPSFLLSYFSYCKEIFVWGMQYYPEHLGRGGCIVWNRKTESQKDVPHADFELCWSKQERNKMAWITWGGFKSKEKGEERLHTTQKPIELAVWFFNNWGNKNDLVADLFLGSGTTMVASHQLKRKCYGMELDPKYCQVIIDRMIRLDPELTIKKNWAERDHATGDYTLLNK